MKIKQKINKFALSISAKNLVTNSADSDSAQLESLASKLTSKKTDKKSPSHNERFGGRRGVTRGTLYRHFESSPPVQTFVNPRPTAKPQGVVCKQTAKFSGDLTR